MELAIPAVALGGLYLISQQQNNKKNAEGMVGYKDLPNTNTRNANTETNPLNSIPTLSTACRKNSLALLNHTTHRQCYVYQSKNMTNMEKLFSLKGQPVKYVSM